MHLLRAERGRSTQPRRPSISRRRRPTSCSCRSPTAISRRSRGVRRGRRAAEPAPRQPGGAETPYSVDLYVENVGAQAALRAGPAARRPRLLALRRRRTRARGAARRLRARDRAGRSGRGPAARRRSRPCRRADLRQLWRYFERGRPGNIAQVPALHRRRLASARRTPVRGAAPGRARRGSFASGASPWPKVRRMPRARCIVFYRSICSPPTPRRSRRWPMRSPRAASRVDGALSSASLKDPRRAAVAIRRNARARARRHPQHDRLFGAGSTTAAARARRRRRAGAAGHLRRRRAQEAMGGVDAAASAPPISR